MGNCCCTGGRYHWPGRDRVAQTAVFSQFAIDNCLLLRPRTPHFIGREAFEETTKVY